MSVQERTFEAQLHLAKKSNKPIVVHCRKEEQRTFALMKKVTTIIILLALKILRINDQDIDQNFEISCF